MILFVIRGDDQFVLGEPQQQLITGGDLRRGADDTAVGILRDCVAAAIGATRAEIASRWYAEEYRPVVRMLRAADMIGSRTEAEAYQRVARERYRLIRTHEWSDEVIERLRREVR